MTAGGSGVASLRGVSLCYGETRAVDDVSLRSRPTAWSA